MLSAKSHFYSSFLMVVENVTKPPLIFDYDPMSLGNNCASVTWEQFVGNKAKGQISKWVFQENKVRHSFRKTIISYPLICTRTCAYQGVRNVKIWRALFSWNTRFKICPFALLPTNCDCFTWGKLWQPHLGAWSCQFHLETVVHFTWKQLCHVRRLWHMISYLTFYHTCCLLCFDTCRCAHT